MRIKYIFIIFLFFIGTMLCGCKKEDNNEKTEKNNKNLTSPFNGTYKTISGEGYRAIIYLDPTDFTNECNEEISRKNVNKYGTPTEVKKGCMKWYVFDETEDKFIMILDHNTTARINYSDNYGNNNYDDSNVKKELEKLVLNDKWLVSPRIISMQEINKIVGNNNWENKMNNGFQFDTLNQNNEKFSNSFRSKYDWLYNYLALCKTDLTDYGCTYEDNNKYSYYNPNADLQESYTYGYWTSTSVENDSNHILQWIIRYSNGSLDSVTDESDHGIRPVIELDKSIINK